VSELPETWRTTTIGAVCGLINGKAFKPADWGTTGLPIVRIQNLNRSDASFNSYSGTVEEKFIIEQGQLLFAWSGTPGTSFGAHIWQGQKAVLNQHIFKVIPNDRLVDKEYLKYAINQTLGEQIDKAHGGVGLRHVTKGRFEETKIPVPPLSEQRRIVAKLDTLTGRTARARGELERIPRLIQTYRESLITSALSGAWTGDGAKGGWADCKARELFTWSSGKFLPKSQQTKGRIPVYGGNGINGTHDRALVDLPTIVVGRVGAQCGNVYLTDGPAWITDNAIFAQTISERVDPWFALLALRHSNLNAQSGGTGQPYVNQDNLNDVEFCLPSRQEQHSILRRMEAAFAWLDRVTAEHANASRLLPKLDHRKTRTTSK
jgi:type I restriction enzyme, S subunit